jgi:hypothetical protein
MKWLHHGTFPPEIAKRPTDRPEIHYAPRHGSQLNRAEIELGILPRHASIAASRMSINCAGKSQRGRTAQLRPDENQMAVHHPRCPHQIASTLFVSTSATE